MATACIAVFIFTVFLRGYWLEQKQSLHVDEALTFSTIFCNPLWPAGKGPLTGREIKQSTVFERSTLQETLKDLYKLHFDVGYSDHTNLYFFLLRAFFINTDIQNFIDLRNHAVYFNLILYTISFVFLFLLFFNLPIEKKIIPFLLLITFSTTGTISTTLLIRPYQLQQTVILVFSFLLLLLYKKKYLESSHYFVFLSLSLAASLVLLSGYFLIIFTSLVFFTFFFLTKNRSLLVSSYIFSFIFSTAFYANFFTFLISFRTSEALAKLSPTLGMENIKYSLVRIPYILNFAFSKYLACVGVVLLLIALYKFFLVRYKNIFFAFLLPAIISSVCIIFLAPYKTLRYISPFIPFFSFLIPLTLSSKKILKFSFLALMVLLSVGSSFIQRPEASNMHTPLETYLLSNSHIPVFVSSNSPTWKYYTFIANIPDSSIFMVLDTFDTLEKEISAFPEVTIIAPRGKKVSVPAPYYVASSIDADYFTILRLKKNSAQPHKTDSDQPAENAH